MSLHSKLGSPSILAAILLALSACSDAQEPNEDTDVEGYEDVLEDSNACGGHSALEAIPGEDCDSCDLAPCHWECADSDSVVCQPIHTIPSGFVRIEPGEFKIGSPSSELGRSTDERLLDHTISYYFYLQEHPVTQAQWEDLTGNNPSRYTDCGGGCPVEKVNWWEAAAYANALSSREGLKECYVLSDCQGAIGEGMTCEDVQVDAADGDPAFCEGYRLPTEAEWEYAARAGTDSATYAGELTSIGCDDETLPEIAWFCGNSNNTTAPVSVLLPNDWGLYDMLGNVGEWVWEYYDEYSSHTRHPTGQQSKRDRVFRGGTWEGEALFARAASRQHVNPNTRFYYLGFRLARSAYY